MAWSIPLAPCATQVKKYCYIGDNLKRLAFIRATAQASLMIYTEWL